MKKIIIILFLSLFLLSCGNNNEIKKEIVEEEKIEFDNIGKNYILAINDKKDLPKLNSLFLNKKIKRYEIGFNIPFNNSYLDYFNNLNNFEYLSIDLILEKGNSNIEKLLNIISKKSKGNEKESVLVLSFINKETFSEKEYEILKKIKISVLEVQGFNVKGENKILNNKINKLLKESQTLKKVIIQDYKIVVK